MNDSIGIDISKTKLDCRRLSDGAFEMFANIKTGFARLHRWIGKRTPERVVYEGQTIGLTIRITARLNALWPSICLWSRSTRDKPADLRKHMARAQKRIGLTHLFWRKWQRL